MKANIQASRPEEIELTLSVTMTLRQWKMIQSAIKRDTLPATEFARIVESLVSKAENNFTEMSQVLQ